MIISKQGLDLIKKREGVIDHVYRDSRGFPTGGCGHLLNLDERRKYPVGIKLGAMITDRWLENDLQKCFNAINDLVKVPLEQFEYDALCSFIFNVGAQGFAHSSTLRELNKGNKHLAGVKLLLWNIPSEIMGRRRAESDQFLGRAFRVN